MDTKAIITEFSQSEKIKAGIIWTSQVLGQLSGLSGAEKKGAVEGVKTFIALIGREAHLARKRSGDTRWMNAEKDIDMALVMIESGVPEEAAFHLTRALTQVTGRAQRAMKILMDKGLL